MAEQAQDAILRAKRLQDLQATWCQRLSRPGGSALPLALPSRVARPGGSALPSRVAESLFAPPVLTLPQAQRLLDVIYHPARNTVRSLVPAGIVQQVGRPSYGRPT